ncbi:MAG TPA: hypothetical protein VG347_11505 [Verrucomicrobiae bacterium]|nr:hypothetical protein [Verrucomicrobiae bacterium]
MGAPEKALPVTSTGTESLVPIDSACADWLIANQNSTTETRGHIFLRLESVIGDHPTMLNVYLGLPGGANPAEHPEHLAGSIGLYGLRQAGMKQETGEEGQGMGFKLDVTRLLKSLKPAGSPAPAAIRVSIVPYRPIPKEAKLTIGKITFFHVDKQ